MWIVAKIKTEQSSIFKQQLKSKLDDQVVYYEAKIFHERKNLKIEKNILGNYIFCFHKKFQDNRNLTKIRYTKGLKYFLSGYQITQSEIQTFIKNNFAS